MFHGDHKLVDSEADRKRITIIAHRLEEETSLTDVNLDSRSRKTTFFFNNFRLEVSPADYLESVDKRDNYWIFFMPNNEVLAAGPSGVHLEEDNSRHSAVDRKKQEVEVHSDRMGRQVRLTD
jgi:hypothetical protein